MKVGGENAQRSWVIWFSFTWLIPLWLIWETFTTKGTLTPNSQMELAVCNNAFPIQFSTLLLIFLPPPKRNKNFYYLSEMRMFCTVMISFILFDCYLLYFVFSFSYFCTRSQRLCSNILYSKLFFLKAILLSTIKLMIVFPNLFFSSVCVCVCVSVCACARIL